jgi:hypothetical protein
MPVKITSLTHPPLPFQQDRPPTTSNLIKCNLRRRLHPLRILVKRTISLMSLFLNRSSILHQLLRNRLAGCFENVDQSARQVLLGFAEESDCAAVLACAAGSADGC